MRSEVLVAVENQNSFNWVALSELPQPLFQIGFCY